MKNGQGRNGKFVAVANMKGGVGKTTTVVSLGESLAADDPKASVLVVDLDPQASASVCIAGDEDLYDLIGQDRTLEAFLEARLIRREKVDLERLVRSKISAVTHQGERLDLSLLPCGPALRIVERELLYELTGRDMSMTAIDGKIWQIFMKDVSALGEIYDYILFDCAPGISPVTEAAIRMADLVIVPTIPDYLSVYGLNAFHGSIWAQRSGSLPKPKSSPHILITRLQNVRQHHVIMRQIVDSVHKEGSIYKLIETSIPQSAGLADALMKGGDLTFTQKYTAPIIAQTLMPLVQEIKGML
jgi:cellulose biosynthesis protein BcsQ